MTKRPVNKRCHRNRYTEMRIVGILGAPHNKGNREQRIRISTYQKLCILQYMISDRLKFLFSVLCSFYCAKPLRIMPSAEQEQKESDGEVKSSERQSWQTKLSELASLQANSGISRQLFPRYRRHDGILLRTHSIILLVSVHWRKRRLSIPAIKWYCHTPSRPFWTIVSESYFKDRG